MEVEGIGYRAFKRLIQPKGRYESDNPKEYFKAASKEFKDQVSLSVQVRSAER